MTLGLGILADCSADICIVHWLFRDTLHTGVWASQLVLLGVPRC